jgi:hypothetical protein
MKYGRVALIALGCLALTAAAEPPLLKNGDFEQGDAGQAPPD